MSEHDRRLRRVLVRAPQAADAAPGGPTAGGPSRTPGEAAAEHEAFRALLAGCPAPRSCSPRRRSGPDPDAIYVYDPALVAGPRRDPPRPGKEGRRGELDAMAADLVEAGVPIAARLERRRSPRAATRSGSTTARSSSGAATGRTTRASRPSGGAARRRRRGVRPPALARTARCSTSCRSSRRSTSTSRSSTSRSCRCGSSSCSRSGDRARRGARRGVRDHGRRTSSRSALAWRSHSTATTRRAGGVEAQASTCASTSGDELSRKGDGGPTVPDAPLLRLAGASGSLFDRYVHEVAPLRPRAVVVANVLVAEQLRRTRTRCVRCARRSGSTP